METILSTEINQKLKKASAVLGLKKEDILKNAVAFYLNNISSYLGLREELDAWDKLSDEALVHFEKKYEKRRNLAS
ncbi:MAG: hypothetical protein AAB371_01965 [Patescibacteria group bacterium]